MKLRYQMRGLGIGIVITALLMGAATKKEIPLSDAEIKAKALALGMVESDSLKLTDIAQIPQPSADETEQNERSEEASQASEIPGTDLSDASDGEEAESSGSGENDSQMQQSGEESDLQTGEESGAESGETVTLTIEFGVTSYHVSQTLEELGLVADATEFDNYLCESGYSRKIAAGVYEIAVGSSEEEIINIITKNR